MIFKYKSIVYVKTLVENYNELVGHNCLSCDLKKPSKHSCLGGEYNAKLNIDKVRISCYDGKNYYAFISVSTIFENL